ncbi:formate dehydrogenase subunit delta [Sphaerotilaceae bacterium SBD11-9]
MNVANLIKMANQIGDYFESLTDPVEAEEGIAIHIKKFWEPRMRRELLAHIDAQGGSGLHPAVLHAITSHRSVLA